MHDLHQQCKNHFVGHCSGDWNIPITDHQNQLLP